MTERTTRLLVMGVVLGTALAAFGARWTLARSEPHATITLHARMASDGGWTPDHLTATVGQPLRLRLTSDDVMHGFAVGRTDLPVVDVKPGQVSEVSLTFTRPGTWRIEMSKRKRKRAKRPGPAPGVDARPRRTRLRWIVAIAGLAALVVTFAGWRTQQAGVSDPVPGGRPALLVTPGSIDLGDVRLGDWATASLQVMNTGTGLLRFQSRPWVSVVEGC